MNNKIYLDYAATTPMDQKVVDVMVDALKNDFGNPSSTHQFGRESKKMLEHARSTIAEFIHAQPDEIIFTSGGSESDNTALFMGAMSRKDQGRHIITTSVEHEAVLKPLKRLEEEGFEVTYLPVLPTGELNFESFKKAVRDDTILVSVMTVNNEVGTIFPIKQIGEFLVERDILFHTDAVQAFGPMEIDVDEFHIDLLSASAHKIYGPKGIGILYKRNGIKVPAWLLGGNQEAKQRAGTENLPAILGFEQAVINVQMHRKTWQAHMKSLQALLLNGLKDAGIDFEVNGNIDTQVPHIVNLYFPNKLAEQLLIQLDLAGFAVSAGSACTAGSVEPSHVLQSMYGDDSPRLANSIRISMGAYTTEAEIKQLVQQLKQIL